MNEKIDTSRRTPPSLPMIALRGIVGFPNMILHFDVAREMSEKALEAALNSDRKIFLLAQRDMMEESPSVSDLYKIGIIAEIRQVLHTGDCSRVLVECTHRAKLLNMTKTDGYLSASYRTLPNYSRARSDEAELTAISRALKEAFSKYGEFFDKLPKELIERVLEENDPKNLFDAIAFNIRLGFADKQMMLEEGNLFLRLTMLYAALSREVEVIEIEQDLQHKVQEHLDKGQREYFLREQMKVISEELGEDDGQQEVLHYLFSIESLGLSEEDTDKLTHEAQRLLKMPSSSQEAYVIRNYLDTVLTLPWGKKTKEKLDIKKASALLDKEHYGLKRVKERVLESMSVHALKPDLTGQIICLVGPPGVGKTSVGRSIAKSLGRKYVRVSLGGVKDEADIRGHRKTYVGAMPGRIMEAIRQAGSMNPMILLDEIDKMSSDYKGDPASAMLEVLDSEQNHAFRDHFLEVPFDLSQVMFVTTANTTETIPAPLLDRMEVIELNSYTREEKFHIAKEHLLKKQIKRNGLRAAQIRITDAAIYDLIDYYTKEAGVRNLERTIGTLCRKAAKTIVSGEAKKVQYTPESLETALGPHKYTDDFYSTEDSVGLVNGLAWTSVGGVLMPLEVLTMDGKGDVQLTGSLGDVMKESAKLAISYVRSVARKYDINPDLFKAKDIHIHAPEGAVPKDGPSAGVTMTTALISAMSGVPVRHDIAMTGEITLHGKVLPIGGLVEKSMAAYKAGIRTVLIPAANVPDLAKLDDEIRAQMKFIPCETLETVLKTALRPPQYDIQLEPLHPEEASRISIPALPQVWERTDTANPKT